MIRLDELCLCVVCLVELNRRTECRLSQKVILGLHMICLRFRILLHRRTVIFRTSTRNRLNFQKRNLRQRTMKRRMTTSKRVCQLNRVKTRYRVGLRLNERVLSTATDTRYRNLTRQINGSCVVRFKHMCHLRQINMK